MHARGEDTVRAPDFGGIRITGHTQGRVGIWHDAPTRKTTSGRGSFRDSVTPDLSETASDGYGNRFVAGRPNLLQAAPNCQLNPVSL